MAYKNFTLEKFIEAFKLKTAFWDNPTEGVKPSPPSAWLTETLKERDRKSTRLNSSHVSQSRMPSSA